MGRFGQTRSIPNVVGPDGIQIQAVAEINDELINGTADYPGELQIFGPNINLDPNSPDGQINNIFAQAKRDELEMIRQVAANFDPAQAVGVWLDRVGSYTAVTRRQGSSTLVNITVTVDRALTIYGVDTAPDSPFTVSDAAGVLYYLSATNAFGGAGSASLQFQAALFGAANPSVNTITVIKTVTLGVVSVNNPGSPTLIGTTEESDFSYRMRIFQCVSKASIGYVGSVDGALYALDGVHEVAVCENITSSIDANGVPAHGLWIIVEFSLPATNATVAQAIYSKRHAGTDQKGATSVAVIQADGTTFTVKFDTPTAQNLWVSFNVAAITGTIDVAWLRAQILANFTLGIYQTADATALVSYIKSIAPNASVTAEGVSGDGITYTATLVPAAVNNQFTLANARIIINGSGG